MTGASGPTGTTGVSGPTGPQGTAGAAGSSTVSYTAGTGGTTINTLMTLSTANPSTAITAPTTNNAAGIIGIATATVSSGDTVAVTQTGSASCVFDGATTAGDYVQASTTVAGDCHDAGPFMRLFVQFPSIRLSDAGSRFIHQRIGGHK